MTFSIHALVMLTTIMPGAGRSRKPLPAGEPLVLGIVRGVLPGEAVGCVE